MSTAESDLPILEQLHFELYGEHRAYDAVDIKPYVKEVMEIFGQNFAFGELAQTYGLEELSVGGDHLDRTDLLLRYIYLYIFLSMLYDRVRDSPAEKARLYDQINHLGSDNNTFGYLKLYTVYYATKFTTWFDHWLPLRFFSTNFLCVNILEAVITDLLGGHFANALTGLFLCVSAPFSVGDFRKDTSGNILCEFTDSWLDLYTSWNALFTYSDGPGSNYFPRTSVCLLNSLAHRKSEWLNSRAYVLFASHVLKSSTAFNNLFSLEDMPNGLIMKDWNRLNHGHISSQLRDVFE